MAAIQKLVHIAVNWGSITGYSGTQTVVSLGFWDSASGGEFLGCGPTGSPIPLTAPDSVNFAIDAIKIKLQGGSGSVMGDGFAKRSLDAEFGAGLHGTIYAGLLLANPAGDGTGGTEFAGGTYARIGITDNSTNFPAAA